MSSTVSCQRCKKDAAAIEGEIHLPAELADLVRERVCADCWLEWQDQEVMVINELRLNFMDPRSQEILVHHMREFLCLDGPPSGPPPGLPAEAP